jgi:enterochelin esterase-like enzyme
MGGRHTMFVGFNSLDLFASFGVLSAGDMDSEKTLAKFLNDPDVNTRWITSLSGRGRRPAAGRMGERCVALAQALDQTTSSTSITSAAGGHDWSTWRHLLYYRFLPNLWRKP